MHSQINFKVKRNKAFQINVEHCQRSILFCPLNIRSLISSSALIFKKNFNKEQVHLFSSHKHRLDISPLQLHIYADSENLSHGHAYTILGTLDLVFWWFCILFFFGTVHKIVLSRCHKPRPDKLLEMLKTVEKQGLIHIIPKVWI